MLSVDKPVDKMDEWLIYVMGIFLASLVVIITGFRGRKRKKCGVSSGKT